MFKATCLTAARLIGASLFASSVSAAPLYATDFDTPTADLAETLSVYSLTTSGGVTAANAAGSVLTVSVESGQNSLDFGAFLGDLHIVLGITTAENTPFNINAGVRIGDNNLLFHPGLEAGPFPAGSFRLEGPGGHGNVSMGFAPDRNVFSRMTIDITAATGLIDITVQDGTNPALVYHEIFQDTNYIPGVTQIGLTIGGGGSALFDQVSISAIPVPAALPLFGFGLAGIYRWRRSRA